MMPHLAIAATVLSSAVILLLCLGDPKRRRSGRIGGEGHGTAVRRTLAVAALLPGIACAFSGSGAAFLIWLGGCGVAGWLVTLVLTPTRQGR